MIHFVTAAVLGCLAALGTTSSALAQSPGQFYAGRSVTLIVPTAPGGINDISGRLVARYLARHVPGKPAIVVQNQPGAGGIANANVLYNSAERDGSVLSMMERAMPQAAIMGDPNARFDPLKFTWLGSLSSYGRDAYVLLINTRHPAKSVTDLKGTAAPNGTGMRANLGGNRSGSTNLTFALIARDILGLNINVIRGYTGAAPMFIAQQRGEIDGQVIGYASVQSGQPDLWKAGQLKPIVQFGRATRLPELPDVPTGRELAPSDEARALIAFAELPFQMALPLVAPPGLPAERTAALRAAFQAMVADPAFLDDAARIGLEISPIDGEAIIALLQRSKATPPQVIERYRQLAGGGG